MPDERTVDVNGLHARFLRAGEDGPPVVLIHGLGASAEIWSANIGALAANHRVFAPDLPGFGRTAVPRGWISAPQPIPASSGIS